MKISTEEATWELIYMDGWMDGRTVRQIDRQTRLNCSPSLIDTLMVRPDFFFSPMITRHFQCWKELLDKASQFIWIILQLIDTPIGRSLFLLQYLVPTAQSWEAHSEHPDGGLFKYCAVETWQQRRRVVRAGTQQSTNNLLQWTMTRRRGQQEGECNNQIEVEYVRGEQAVADTTRGGGKRHKASRGQTTWQEGEGGTWIKWVAGNVRWLGGEQHNKRKGADDTLQGDGVVDNTTRGESRWHWVIRQGGRGWCRAIGRWTIQREERSGQPDTAVDNTSSGGE